MITATHAIVYADDPDQARAFFRDVLELPNVDIHGGWLIFKLPPPSSASTRPVTARPADTTSSS